MKIRLEATLCIHTSIWFFSTWLALFQSCRIFFFVIHRLVGCCSKLISLALLELCKPTLLGKEGNCEEGKCSNPVFLVREMFSFLIADFPEIHFTNINCKTDNWKENSICMALTTLGLNLSWDKLVQIKNGTIRAWDFRPGWILRELDEIFGKVW